MLLTVSSFRFTNSNRLLSRKVSNQALPDVFSSMSIAAVEVATKPDDYVYGAVSAPSWALPIGAILVILTAALPILLKPGEQALEQQRADEETKGTQFGRKKKDL
eukprot:gene8238-16941_t